MTKSPERKAASDAAVEKIKKAILVPAGWIIIAKTKPNLEPLTEWFAVAIRDRDTALNALKLRKDLFEAELMVAGEATSEFLSTYDVRDGQILSLWAFVDGPGPVIEIYDKDTGKVIDRFPKQ